MIDVEDAGWVHTPDGGLALAMGGRTTPVPAPLATLLLGPDALGLSPVAAVDVLRLETLLRRMVATLSDALAGAERRVSAAQAAVTEASAHARRGRRGRHLDDAITEAIAHQAATARGLRNTRELVSALRAWVIGLEPATGWLAEAAAGWARAPEPYVTVTIYPTEDAFLDADPRREAATDWGGRRIDGIEPWGQGWRRDGDDDDPRTPPSGGVDRGGYWSLGYLARTGEVYAIRRSPHLPHEVWALGTVAAARASARDLLDPIAERMREPNSVVLASVVVGEAVRRWVA